MRDAVSTFVINPVSPSIVRSHTPDMVYTLILLGILVTIETLVLRSPMTGVDWPTRQTGYATDHTRWRTIMLIGTSQCPFGMSHPWSGRSLVTTRADMGQ
jgi:hypothetical protein